MVVVYKLVQCRIDVIKTKYGEVDDNISIEEKDVN
jgi:hypothetical protein